MLPAKTPFPNILKNHRFLFLGTSSLTFGLVILLLKSWIIEVLTASVIVLQPNNALEGFWRKTPVDLPTNVYFFNWTNPEAIHDFKIKPQFEEVGPYKFKQKLEKVNIVWNDNNTVTYNQMRTFSYDNEEENGDLSDMITSINAVTLACAHYIQNWNYFLKRGASMVFSAVYPTVDTTRSANQLLLEGYDDIIVDIAKMLPFIASEIPRFDKFGWLFILNGTSAFEGAINMDDGEMGNFEIRQWNYESKLTQFTGSCAELGRSSAGELYPHTIKREYIEVFIPQFCRNLRFDYVGNVTVDGISGYKFAIGAGVLDNGTLIPENKCYCAGKCIPSGVFNISSCRYGLPTYGSLPHFYGADQYYLENVEGLQPREDKHQSYIILEPTTGAPIEAALRIQLNMYLHPIDSIMVYEDVPELYFPLLWVETSASLPHYMKILLKIYLISPQIMLGASLALTLLGLYMLLFIAYKPFFVSFYKHLHRKKRNQPVKSEEVPLRCDVEIAFANCAIENDEWEKPLVNKFTLR
ncbi:protein peste-like isoform X2 [Photinus pyralis]|nr:protein peste-like isoform X2 [Photinus pyralis]